MIIIKYCNTHIMDDSCISKYLELLPAFMGREISKFKTLADKKAKILSRLMLRDSMTDASVSNDLSNWNRDDNNKPFIKHWYSFNISHSQEFVVLAYTIEETIGIDIEKMEELEYFDLIKYFHSDEQLFIESREKPIENFYEIWVKKEALLKAVGTGLTESLCDFDCTDNNLSYRGQNWYLKEILINLDYKCYICSPNPVTTLDISEFILDKNTINMLK